TQDSRATTAWVEKAATPSRWLTGSASKERRLSPERSVPAAFALAAGSQSAGRPEAHGPQRPQLGTNTSTTWSPAWRSVTPSPTASTIPAASWPSAMGVGRGREPSITDRAEWQRPAAAIFTWTSPRPGGGGGGSAVFGGFSS